MLFNLVFAWTLLWAFIDLKKSFVTVDHDILPTKLEHYGVRWLANNWSCSYQKGREQFVFICNERWTIKDIVSFIIPIYINNFY